MQANDLRRGLIKETTSSINNEWRRAGRKGGKVFRVWGGAYIHFDTSIHGRLSCHLGNTRRVHDTRTRGGERPR